MEQKILAAVAAGDHAVKPKALARKLKIPQSDYIEFRRLLKKLVRKGKVEKASGRALRQASAHESLLGVFHSIRAGGGFVKPRPGQGKEQGDVYVRPENALDAAGGDVVLVGLLRRAKGPGRGPEGKILEVVERASDRFVGAYLTRGGEAFVKVDGGLFHEPIYVGDPGVKGAGDGDKVVIEMLRFPSAEMTAEAVVVEVLGPAGKPGVDLLSVIHQFHLPVEFSPEALGEAREESRVYEKEVVPADRLDLTGEWMVTIDPVDARDFDDAVSLTRDERGFWRLGVHIADVSTFVRPGSALDREARDRGTSVYLPGRVVPMLPELISNGLASLQEGRLRLVKSVFIEFDPDGRITHVELANAAIRVKRRLTYEAVLEFFEHPHKHQAKLTAEVRELLTRMRELAAILRERRRKKGLLELSMPAPELEYDDKHRVVGAHYSPDDESHRMIEEFMVTANEAVARTLEEADVDFLRRVHEIPDPRKLKAFAEFAASVGVKMEDYRSRFELQQVLRKVADQPTAHAVNYALLRSLKEAVYSPDDEGHFALASDCYCHFTSPIRRYPDLTVHRLVDQLLRRGKASSRLDELVVLGEHCSFTERRAAKAERELVKIKLLQHLSDKVGEEWDMIVTGVEQYGIFAQGLRLPAEGLIHVRTLTDDFYELDRATHSLVGKQRGRRYRLGDKIRCTIVGVDVAQRQLDLRLAPTNAPDRPRTHAEPTQRRSRKKKAGPEKSRRKR